MHHRSAHHCFLTPLSLSRWMLVYFASLIGCTRLREELFALWLHFNVFICNDAVLHLRKVILSACQASPAEVGSLGKDGADKFSGAPDLKDSGLLGRQDREHKLCIPKLCKTLCPGSPWPGFLILLFSQMF